MPRFAAGDAEPSQQEKLDAALMAARQQAHSHWPYTGTNDHVRELEAEYARLGLDLPEMRDE